MVESLHKQLVPHGNDPVSMRCNRRVVRDHDDGALIFVQVLEDLHDCITGLCVKIPCCLVRDNDWGVVYECSCDCNTLTLSG